jgi:hypothetical protein
MTLVTIDSAKQFFSAAATVGALLSDMELNGATGGMMHDAHPLLEGITLDAVPFPEPDQLL